MKRFLKYVFVKCSILRFNQVQDYLTRHFQTLLIDRLTKESSVRVDQRGARAKASTIV